jgi:1,4-alpha-glucan branching enzyme
MGNEFGHPEWIDFPREGNGGSYHYCRRQWSLVDNPELKYAGLARFDRALLDLARTTGLLNTPPAQVLLIDHESKILVAERANLIFVCNFSVTNSHPGYPIRVPDGTSRKLLLNTDTPESGGHGRVDPSSLYPVDARGIMKIYSPSRTGLVFARI